MSGITGIRPAMVLTEALRVELLAEVLSYGLGWADPHGDSPTDYTQGGVDTLGHMAACCLCQWFNLQGVPTCETVDALDLHKEPSRAELVVLIGEYLEDLQK